jgi:ABC-type dipeptide/oligopeptide/nickel transport system permease subunit
MQASIRASRRFETLHDLRELAVSAWCQPMGRAGLAGIALLLLLALISTMWTPCPPEAISGPSLSPPSLQHLLGTNGLGQDILSQVLAGCRVSLLIAVTVGLGATAAGFLAGSAAGYYPRRLGVFLMRVVDVLMTIPRLPLIILLAVFLGSRLVNVLGVLIFLTWPGVARTIRAQVLSLRERDPIRFARFSGATFFYILRRHLLWELFPLLPAKAVTAAGYAIVAEVGLGFLGLGDPNHQSWGLMIRSALDYPGLLWTEAWSWWLLPPSLMVSLAVLSFTLAGYGLDEALHLEKTP